MLHNKDILNIFNNYDSNLTAKNVNSFFKNFKRIARMAGRNPMALKSPVISDMPSSKSIDNNVENKMVEYVSARDTAPKIFNDVQYALSLIPKRSREIILGAYIDELTDEIMAQRIGYSKSSYRRFKEKALNEFADALCSCETVLRIDLHKSDGELV